MSFKKALRAFLLLCALLSFFFMSAFFFILPFSSAVRLRFIHALAEDSSFSLFLGGSFLTLATLLLWGFYWLERGKFLLLNMGKKQFTISPQVIKETLKHTLGQEFLGKVLLRGVEVGPKGKLEISVFIEPVLELQSALAQIEQHLETLLRKKFGYSFPFTLVLQETR